MFWHSHHYFTADVGAWGLREHDLYEEEHYGRFVPGDPTDLYEKYKAVAGTQHG